MRYSEELIEEIRSRNDILQVVGEVVQLKRAGRNYFGRCPFHNEKTPSFSVNQQKQIFHCFGCGAGGNVLTFVMQYHNMSFMEALRFLADRAGISLPEPERSSEEKSREEHRDILRKIQKNAAGYFYYLLRQPAGEAALRYLRERELSDETIRNFGLGFAGRGGLYPYLKKKGYSDADLAASGLISLEERRGAVEKFWNRVMFPIPDSRGRIIGFGGRVMGDGKPKYLNSPETEIFNKRRNLFGLHLARASRRPYMILCEGYMDVISLHQAGFDCAVASLGTALTEEQARLISRFTKDVRLLYDSDRAGQMAARRAEPILRAAGLSSSVVDLSPYKDPDELLKAMGGEEMERRLAGGRDALLFAVDSLEAEHPKDDPREKTAFQTGAAELLAGVADELLRNNYIEAVAREKRIPEDLLRREVNRFLARGTRAETYRPPEDVSAPKKKEKRPDALLTSQRLLLAYIAAYPEAYARAKEYLVPADFQDPLCREVAEGLFRQMQEDGAANIARLIGRYEDPETQQMVEGIFQTNLGLTDDDSRDRAFTDTLLRLLEASNEARMATTTDIGLLADLLKTKKKIGKMKADKVVFHLSYKEDGED